MNFALFIEAILFSAGRSLSFKELARIAKCDEKLIAESAESLQSEYAARKSGIRLVISPKSVELATAPEYQDYVKNFIIAEKSSITRAQIDTLAVLAYNGTLSQGELEQIRGVNCSIILKNLSLQGLIEKIIDGVEEPRYAVTTEFLKGLGITALSDLPDYRKPENA